MRDGKRDPPGKRVGGQAVHGFDVDQSTRTSLPLDSAPAARTW